MKNILIVISIIFFSCSAFADQLAFLSKKQATIAVELLNNHNSVLLYCGCCDSDQAKYINVKSVSMRSADYKSYYEVVIESQNEFGATGFSAVDLAYVFVNESGYARSVGELLKFECDPCVSPFVWEFDEEIENEESQWIGTWKFIDHEISYEYQINIDSLNCSYLNICTYRVEGEDNTFYTLDLIMVEKQDRLSFYFWDYREGTFYAENDFIKNEPVLELVNEGGEIVSYWYQLPGAENGLVSFARM